MVPHLHTCTCVHNTSRGLTLPLLVPDCCVCHCCFVYRQLHVEQAELTEYGYPLISGGWDYQVKYYFRSWVQRVMELRL